MDDNLKKRKKSFANDRLKRLRTSINTEIVTTSSSPNTKSTPKVNFTPSVKNSIPNNPTGYQERKKLKATRKLKTAESNRNLEITNGFKQNDKNISVKQPEVLHFCTPKRQKLSVSETERNPVYNNSNITPSISATTRNLNPQKPDKSLEHRNEKANLHKPQFPTNRSEKNQPSISDRLTPRRNSNNNDSLMRNDKTTNFSDICLNKTKFEFQHNARLQTPQSNTQQSGKVLAQCSTGSSKQYSKYFADSLNLIYNKLFGSQNDSKKITQAAGIDSMDWEPDGEFNSIAQKDKDKSEREMYIIVDTNIFLDSLSFLDGIMKYGSNDGLKPVIYVPWMVFNELDFIKDNRSSGLKSAASKAIDFINKSLTQKEGRLMGQSIFEANEQMHVGKSPDDKITSCCLQVKEKGLKAVLLSNDKNLRNKLIINGVPSFSSNDFLKIFDDTSPHKDKINMLLDEMGKCCTSIISDVCQEAYGDVWNKLALLDDQPWNFKSCLEIFRKYWSAVFRDKLLKQCLKTVEKMISSLKNSDCLKNPSTFDDFAKECLSLCFFLTDLEQHKDLIEETTKKINSLVGQKS